jgi:hypothetical protein
MLQNASDYLASDAEKLINVKNWDQSFNTDIVAATHFLMRFSILDRLADAYGLPRQPSFLSAGRRFLPNEVPAKFINVRYWHLKFPLAKHCL